jgi:hypothetical protein
LAVLAEDFSFAVYFVHVSHNFKNYSLLDGESQLLKVTLFAFVTLKPIGVSPLVSLFLADVFFVIASAAGH